MSPAAGTNAKAIAGSMFGRKIEFPKDSIVVKTLSVASDLGDPPSRRRVETQVLHFDGEDWRGYTYQWNDEQSDATLVPATGADRVLDIRDADAPGGRSTSVSSIGDVGDAATWRRM